MERFHGRLLDLRVFLEGIEVDVLSASVRGGFGAPASAVIQLPFTAASLRLHPRTLVHIFYFENTADLPNPTATDRNSWRLLFAGEVVSFQHSDAGSVKQMNLMCQDFSTYWQQAKLYWGTNNLANYNYRTSIALGAVRAYSGTKRVSSTDALINLINAKPATIPRLSGILGGVVALLESATGVFHPKAKRTFRGMTDYMSQAELRLKLTHMIGAAPDDTTSIKFFDSSLYRQYLRRLGRSIGQTASYMDLVNLFLGRIYYSWASLPAPPYFPEDAGDKAAVKVLKEQAVKRKDDGTGKDLAIVNALLKEVRRRRIEGANRRGAGKAVINSGDPVRYLRYGGPDLPGVNEENKAGFASFPLHCRSFISMVGGWDSKSVNVEALRNEPGDAYSRWLGTVGKARYLGTEAASLIRTKLMAALAEYTDRNLFELESLLTSMSSLMGRWRGGGVVRTLVDGEVAVGDRLHAHLFVPDLYMAPPPTCNVLFPDHYSSLQFSRNWMSEITRLMLHTRTQTGRDVKDMYFSPNTDILGMALTDKDRGQDLIKAIRKGVSFLMPHEKYTGVLAVSDAVGDVSIFKRIHQDVKAAEERKDPKHKAAAGQLVSGEAQYSPMEHLRRAANYLFFAKRFEGRSMSIVARFSPQIVMGLPMLVITKTPADAEVDPGSGKKGTHFLGLVVGLSHEVDARGSAITRVELSKCRDHREGLDIFGENTYDTATKEKKVTKVVTLKRSRKRVAYAPMKPGGQPGATFSGIPTDEEFNDYALSPKEALKQVGVSPKEGAQYTISIKEIGGYIPSSVTNLGPEMATTVATPQPIDIDARVELPVTESTRGSTAISKEITFSFENTVTPPWLADIYLPVNIGQSFYQKMLGCGSVFDAALIPTADTAATSLKRQDAATDTTAVRVVGLEREVELPNHLLAPQHTIERAADQLSEAWELLKRHDADAVSLIELYTRRHYATLPQIMGNGNPDLSFIRRTAAATTPDKGEGFHENAYGLLSDMKDVNGLPLQYEPLPTATGVEPTGSDPAPAKSPESVVSSAVDPRADRYARVAAHARALEGIRSGFNAKE